MRSYVGLVLGFAVTAGHFAAIAAWYDALPASIPAFVDAAGQPVVGMGRSPLVAVRLPLMALVTQLALAVMARVPVPDERASFADVWGWLALVVGLKLALESATMAGGPRAYGLVAVLVGEVLLVVALARWWRTSRPVPSPRWSWPDRRGLAGLAACAGAYAALVAMPWW